MRDIFFEVAGREFLLSSSFCPVKRGNRAGSSRNEFDYSRRGTQTTFPLLDFRSCEGVGLARFSIFLLEKEVDEKQNPLLDQLSVFWLHNSKMSLFEILATATLEKQKTWSGYLSESSQTHSERRPGSISSLYGAKTNLKAKKYSRVSVCNLKKWSPAYKTALSIDCLPFAYTRSHYYAILEVLLQMLNPLTQGRLEGNSCQTLQPQSSQQHFVVSASRSPSSSLYSAVRFASVVPDVSLFLNSSLTIRRSL